MNSKDYMQKPKYMCFERIKECEIGDMVLIQEKALVVKSGDTIVFLKQIPDDKDQELIWKKYHTLQLQGQPCASENQKSLTVVTDEKVYFYSIDNDDLLPCL